MTVLITGASGHLGRVVVKKFLTANYPVVGFDLPTKSTHKVARSLLSFSKKYAKNLTITWGDISKKTDIEAVFEQELVDGVIHLAFILPPYSEMNPERSRQVNVKGTRHIVELVEKYLPTRPFIFASSLAVYGPIDPNDPPLTINRPLKPYNHYNTHKIECEEIITKSQINWRILRLSAVLNKELKPDRELLKYSLSIPLNTKVQPVHVNDVATAMLHAFEREQASRKIFLIAGPEHSRLIYKEYIFQQLAAVFPKLSEEEIPWEKYGKKPYYLHWCETKESQDILQYQEHDFEDFIKEIEEQASFITRWLLRVPFIRKKSLMKMFPD